MALPPANAPDGFISICEGFLTEQERLPFFTAAELKEAVTARFAIPGGSVLPNDHCFNWTNEGVGADDAPLFLRRGTSVNARGFESIGKVFTEPADFAIHHRPRTGPLRGQLVRVRSRLDRRPVDETVPGPDDAPVTFPEGAILRTSVDARERSGAARAACVRLALVNHPENKLPCGVCGDALADLYGEAAESLIHVHHLHPLADRTGTAEVNPAEDLICVCPNCHAVIHHGGVTRGIAEVRALRAAGKPHEQV